MWEQFVCDARKLHGARSHLMHAFISRIHESLHECVDGVCEVVVADHNNNNDSTGCVLSMCLMRGFIEFSEKHLPRICDGIVDALRRSGWCSEFHD